jgi:hypothetical protein
VGGPRSCSQARRVRTWSGGPLRNGRRGVVAGGRVVYVVYGKVAVHAELRGGVNLGDELSG